MVEEKISCCVCMPHLKNKLFQRRTEDFVCAQCGHVVQGNGYTNHCPLCLFSVHVDVFPGDRLAQCGGLMEPMSIERRGSEYQLTHRCVQCGHIKNNKTSSQDDFEALLALARRRADQ